MANLLPRTQQQAVFIRALVRVSVAVMGILSAVALVGLFALVPAYLTAQTQQATLNYELESLKKASGGVAQSNRTAVADANRQINILNNISTTPLKISNAVAAVIAARPKGMTLNNFAYTAPSKVSATSSASLTVSGTLAQQSDESTYLASLRKDSLFSSVDIPIAALAHSDPNAITVVLRGSF